MLAKWETLPEYMQNAQVAKYYKTLQNRKFALLCKRVFDVCVASVLAVVLLPLMLVIALVVKLDSPGKIFYKQKRVTQGGRVFNVLKFRTMVENADKIGAKVTSKDDARITKIGKWLRKLRLDELPQIFNVLSGELSFVGVRPEVPEYVSHYTPEMYATLLLPAGVTSLTSILYKDEDKLLEGSQNPEKTYINEILPQKMKYNLEYIRNFSFWDDILVMVKTVLAVVKK